MLPMMPVEPPDRGGRAGPLSLRPVVLRISEVLKHFGPGCILWFSSTCQNDAGSWSRGRCGHSLRAGLGLGRPPTAGR